jgi:hypothetical protein
MSALVNNQRRMARRSKLKPRGEEEMSSARRSSVHHHKISDFLFLFIILAAEVTVASVFLQLTAKYER